MYERRVRVRYFLSIWLFVLSGVAFLDRTNISIAGLQISREYGLGNQRLGWIFSAFLIGYAGFHLLREGAQVLSDHSPLPSGEIATLVRQTPGVVDCHNIRARGSKNRITMDLNIHVPQNMTVLSAHEIAHRIEERIREHYPAVVEVVVHIEPDQEESHDSVKSL